MLSLSLSLSAAWHARRDGPALTVRVALAQVDKQAKKYELDSNGNIVNPPSSGGGGGTSGCAFGGGGSTTSSGFAFGGGGGGASTGAGVPGFVFGGAAPAAGAGGGFVFGGGAGAPAAKGFVFGAGSPPGEKRKAGVAERKTGAKKRRVRELRLNGDETGDVMIVGNGDCGQLGLGDGDDDTRDSLVPLVVASLSAQGIVSIACGGMHTVAVTVDGKLWTWGNNDDEALGRQGNESLPGLVEGGLRGVHVQMVSAGDSHSAALSRDGRVFTWGVYKDSNGYIGHSPGLKKAVEPLEMAVFKGKPIKWIASGVDHTFAVAANDFDVYSWGCGEQGQLGPLVTWQTDGKKKEENQKHLAPWPARKCGALGRCATACRSGRPGREQGFGSGLLDAPRRRGAPPSLRPHSAAYTMPPPPWAQIAHAAPFPTPRCPRRPSSCGCTKASPACAARRSG